MDTLTNPFLLALLASLAVGLTIYALAIPKKPHIKINKREVVESTSDNNSIRFMSKIGSEVYASLPSFSNTKNGKYKSKSTTRTENIIIKSGNPWKVTPEEFTYLRIVFGFLGFIFGLFIGFLMGIPIIIGGVAFAILGVYTPYIKYTEAAKKRDISFTKELPEALDLIIISLSAGVALPEAIRESIPNMQEGVMKEEFKKIISDLDSGRPLDATLKSFGERSPNEGIKTFVAAVRQSNKLDTPMEESFQARAEASRNDYISLVKNKSAKLTSRIFIFLTPTLIPAIAIISAAPSVKSFMENF